MSGAYDFQLPGNDEFRVNEAGVEYTLLGSTNAPKGSVVLQGYDDTDPLLDAGKVSGPGSPTTTVQIPVAGDAAKFGVFGKFGVVKSDPLVAGKTGFVAFERELVDAEVQVPDGGLDAGQMLMVDLTDANLELADGTTRAIARLAIKASNSSGSTQVQTLPVRLMGDTGYAG